jgi:YfiH family protein
MSTKLGGNPSAPYYNNLSKFVGDDEKIVMQNRQIFFTAIGAEGTRTAHGNQVHSSSIAVADKPGLYRQTDALITKEKNLFLIISVADCLPVMIYDRSKHIAANVHSGWRGTEKGITVSAVEKMKNEFGCNPRDMYVFVGPGISKDCFELLCCSISSMFQQIRQENSV